MKQSIESSHSFSGTLRELEEIRRQEKEEELRTGISLPHFSSHEEAVKALTKRYGPPRVLNQVMKATYTSRAVMTPYGKFFPPVTIEEAIAQEKRNNAQIGVKDDPYMGKSYSEIKKMENFTMEESTK